MTTVDLVTGLLGAGKTTFIKGYIDYLKRNGIDCAVIENEFGRAGVDTALLMDTGVRISELTGGCICCGLKVDFVQALLELSAGFQRIVVEPSGVFTLGDFYDVMSAPAVQKCCKIGTVVTVVNGSAQLNEDDLKLFTAQITGTGVALLNRGAKNNCDVPVIVDNGLTDEDYERIMGFAPNIDPSIKADIDHASIYQSCSLTPTRSFSQEEVEGIIQSLFSPECGEVLRVKGTMGDLFVSATRGYTTVTPGSGEPMLNVIGRQLKRKKIKELLK